MLNSYLYLYNVCLADIALGGAGMGKLELNKKRKKSALYNTAFELFTTKGLAKTTISDIVENAGVAKGTFYLYFKDKYDIRNKLISHKAGELFSEARNALEAAHITGFTAQLHFIVDNILDRLQTESSLLGFISKNLSWGVFKDAFQEQADEEDFPFFQEYLGLLGQSDVQYDSPELLLFTIIELVSSTSYSCILHSQPVSLDEYRPYLHRTIDCILLAFTHGTGGNDFSPTL